MAFETIRDGLTIVGRPNGRHCIVAWGGRLYEEDYLNAALFFDFSSSGARLFFQHPETETQESRRVLIADLERYDRALSMQLEAQKLVDFFLFQKMSFDGIQNFMAVCRRRR